MSANGPLLEAPERVLSTLNQDGSRRWLRPKVARGRWWRRRAMVGWGLIALFNILPWVRLGGEPLVLLDVMHRRFIMFGAVFRPTETLLLAFLMLSVFLGIFMLTALFGRVWCGWACPQTVYLEFVYRPIQRLIEGRSADKGEPPAPARTLLLRLVYLVVSFHLAHTFLAYFVSTDVLLEWTLGSPQDHPTGFLIVLGVTALMVFDFGWFREQMCILACPYGRLQSVLLDRRSLVVGYDARRGEPRGKLRKAAGEDAAPRGDCIDCKWCLAVCPTGIDIRDGLQMECIHCTECVDACDAVMDKVGRPRGLIRYSSQDALAGEKAPFLRPRTLLYPAVIVLLLSLFGWRLAGLESALVLPLRVQNTPFSRTEEGSIRNVLTFSLENQSDRDHVYQVEIVDRTEDPGMPRRLTAPTFPLKLDAGAMQEFSLIVESPVELFERGRGEVVLRFTDEEDFEHESTRALLGPFQLGGG